LSVCLHLSLSPYHIHTYPYRHCICTYIHKHTHILFSRTLTIMTTPQVVFSPLALPSILYQVVRVLFFFKTHVISWHFAV
jgi:hypothetical protein